MQVICSVEGGILLSLMAKMHSLISLSFVQRGREEEFSLPRS